MKKILLLLTILSLATTATVKAQDTVYLKKEAKKKIFTDRPPQALYVELGGAGLVYSINYDRRFNNQTDGFGFRGGLGYSFTNSNNSGASVTTVPVGINYLAGNNKKGRFFEVGLQETYLTVHINNNNTTYGYQNSYDIFDTNVTDNSSLLVTTIALGYRSQPIAGGFNFRAGLLPYLVSGNSGVGAYLSFGYNF